MYATSSKPKRQLVKAACTSCQKRKVKCSGERPTCALCQSRAQICTYDSEAGLTRVEALRRRNKELAEQNAEYELVYTQLQNTPEAEALEHLRNLREFADVETYAKSLKRRPSISKRRLPADGVDEDADGNGDPAGHLSPMSNQSQGNMDGDGPSHANPSPTRMGSIVASQSPSMMIDPRLEFTDPTTQTYQQFMGLPLMPGSSLEPTGTWGFGLPDGHYGEQMFDPGWIDEELLPPSLHPSANDQQPGHHNNIHR